VDAAIQATARADTKSTIHNQDLNNFAPRFGFAYMPFDSNKLVVRGGYGVFFDRPSAAFINTVFSNYPHLREEEVTFPGSNVPLNLAWSQQDPNFPFSQYFPNRVVRTGGANGTYQIRDNTNVIAVRMEHSIQSIQQRGCHSEETLPRRLSSVPSIATCALRTSSNGTWAHSMKSLETF
jgi:hypothetical protein